jgi:hypothetical protein
MFAYVSNIWCYSAPCGSCFWQTSQISPYPWQLILRVQTVGTVFKWICVMLSHTSLIVSSTFMACIYKHTHTHTHTHTQKWLFLSPSVLPLKTEAKAKQQEMDFDSSCEVTSIEFCFSSLSLLSYLFFCSSFWARVVLLSFFFCSCLCSYTCTARLVISIFLLNFYQTHLIQQLENNEEHFHN